jgi:serine/threonine protein kinase/tetratricopeptide (TPR) repeat protein
MVPRVGQRVGPYEILGRLGSGGMGLVFSAWDARLQRDVAIKLLREEYATPDMRSRFLQEARAASGLNHPNICTIFDIGEQGGDPYLVMELLKGETLRARIASGTISPDDIIRVASEVADALAVAHTRGIIHRDIKPANIILVDKPGGRFGTKVLDFGLAKVDLGDGMDRFDLTSVGSTVGTVSYMSPEQARGEPLDARSDLFSLGVVLYEMGTGQVPFRGATSALVFVQLLSAAPELPRELNAALPKDLEKVILKLLEKDRAGRYQSAGELVEALHKIPLKGSGAGKSIWGAIPALVRNRDSSSARDQTEITAQVEKKAAETQTRTLPVGESMLRPVRRIVTSDSEMPSPMVSATAAAAQLAAASADQAVSVETPPPSSSRPAATERLGGASLKPVRASSSTNVGPMPSITLPRSAPRLPAPRFKRMEDDDEPVRPKVHGPRVPANVRRAYPWLLTGIAAVVAGVSVWLFWPRHAPVIASPTTTVVMASLTNHTGDDILSGVLVAGLEFDLRQSPHLTVRNEGALAASMKALDMPNSSTLTVDQARLAGQAIGANDLLFEDVSSDGGGYTVGVRVYDAATGAISVTRSESAASREQLPDAIDRLATDIRSGLGESGDAIAKTAVPLRNDASSNLDALEAYYTGETLLRGGPFLDAMHAFERANVADPRFAQAQMELSDLYRRQRAMTASGHAAAQAMANTAAASARTKVLAQAMYAMEATGDVPQAVTLLQEELSTYPGDSVAMVQLSQALRAEGKFSESLDMSQRVLHQDPYDLDAAGNAEMAMLALNLNDAASNLETQIERSGATHPGLRQLLVLLGSREDGQMGVDLSDVTDRIAPAVIQAQMMDAGGLLKDGLGMWKSLAARAVSSPELVSAAGEELSAAALDRALVNDCTTAQDLVHEAAVYPTGAQGIFDAGMASALCANLDAAKASLAGLQRGYPQSFAAKAYFYPDLMAVIQWKGGDADGALKTLQTAKQYDLISLTPYLRGMIHLRAGQPQAAIVDFQAMLLHRGATTLVNPLLYPMAEIGVARSYQASGDQGGNSATAYRNFLASWRGADAGLEMVREAKAATAQ